MPPAASCGWKVPVTAQESGAVAAKDIRSVYGSALHGNSHSLSPARVLYVDSVTRLRRRPPLLTRKLGLVASPRQGQGLEILMKHEPTIF